MSTAPNISGLPKPHAVEEAPRLAMRDRLLNLEDLAKLPPVRPLVDGLLYRGTLTQLSAAPGKYKTFLAVGMSCAVALGQSWEGHRVPEGGPVIYVVPEGASGMRARVLAWCRLNGVDPSELHGRLKFLPVPIQLGSYLDVAEAEILAAELGAHLVVLDTRARCTLGLEENSATEQGKAIDAAERIVAASDATVLAVHHAGRNGSHGRGSTAWDGQVWSNLVVTAEYMRASIKCEKHKDVPDGCEHHYRLVPDTVPEDLMPGCTVQQRSTLVAVQMGDLDYLSSDRRSTRAVLDIVRTSGGNEGLTRAQIADFAKDHDLGRSTAFGAVNTLVKAALLRNVGSEKRARYVLTGAQSAMEEPE